MGDPLIPEPTGPFEAVDPSDGPLLGSEEALVDSGAPEGSSEPIFTDMGSSPYSYGGDGTTFMDMSAWKELRSPEQFSFLKGWLNTTFMDTAVSPTERTYVPKKNRSVDYIDNNLVQGSADPIRRLLGGFYERLSPADTGIPGLTLQFNSCNNALSTFESTDEELTRTSLGAVPPKGPIIKNIWTFPHSSSMINSPYMLDTLELPIMFGSTRFLANSRIENDEEWRKFIIGGDYFTSSYRALVSDAYHEDQVFNSVVPYEMLDLKRAGVKKDEFSAYEITELKSVRNYPLDRYYVSTRVQKSDLLLPNYYAIAQQSGLRMGDNQYSRALAPIRNYTELGNDTYKSSPIFTELRTIYPPPVIVDEHVIPAGTDGSFIDNYLDPIAPIKKYLLDFTNKQFLTELEATVATHNSNVLMAHQSNLNRQFNLEYQYRFPYYNKISIPVNNEYTRDQVDLDPAVMPAGFGRWTRKDLFYKTINTANSEEYIGNMLKKAFVDGDNIETKNLTKQTRRVTKSDQDKIVEEITATDTNLRYIDLLASITNELNNEFPNRPNIVDYSKGDLIFDPMTNQNKMAAVAIQGDESSSRFFENTSLLHTLMRIISMYNSELALMMGLSSFPKPQSVSTGHVIYKPHYFTFANFLNLAGKQRYSETIGYRIEKVGGGAINAARQEASIQNILLMRGSDRVPENGALEYIDTQIRPDVSYTYNLYEYRIVVGYRYRLNDPKVSRSIGIADRGAEGSADPIGTAGGDKHCLEFYDPYSGEVKPVSWSNHGAFGRILNSYATPAQRLSDFPYLANATLQLEPFIRVYEVPITTKELTNMDNPPGRPDVTPYQRQDDSQVIGFRVLHESFKASNPPEPLNDQEEDKIQRYLNSRNLLLTDLVDQDSTSAVRYVEIYRIDKKPNSLRDFNNALVATKDLIIDPSKEIIRVHTDCFYEEKINTNKNYYYTFRFVNQDGMPGGFSGVYEVQLIDDGGYKFAQFNNILLEELGSPFMVNSPSKELKKLMQIVPNIEQVALNDTDVDYSRPAASQINKVTVGSSDKPIWDRKFKVRLTSKKTGKKIDLNIIYKIKEE